MLITKGKVILALFFFLDWDGRNSPDVELAYMYTQEDTLNISQKWVSRVCDNTNGRLGYVVYWVKLYAGGSVNSSFVLSHSGPVA